MEKDIRKKIYLKLFYSLLDWEWYTDGNTMRVFLHLILTANRKDKSYMGDVIHAGESLSSLEHISTGLNLSVQQVRTALDKLKSTGEITVRKVGKTSVIRINKYKEYQFATEFSTTNQQQINNEITTNQHRDNIELTSLRYCNNEDIEENDKMKECVKQSHTLGKFNNVIITDEEYSLFRKDYPLIADRIIDELSAKIMTGDKRYTKGHIGHLYIFAENHRQNKPRKDEIKAFDPSCSDMTGINEKILAMSRNLDPTQTKRRCV